MKVKVDKVLLVRGGAEVLLTLRFEALSPRVHTYRVKSAVYEAAGSPMEGDVLAGDALSLLTADEDRRLAYARAARILSVADNTRASLLRKLRERGFSAESAEAAVARLVSEGYIKEEDMLLRQLAICAKRLWGPKKVIPTLLRKGFSRADIEMALRKARDEGIYDAEAIREALLCEVSDEDAEAQRAHLYRHGF